MRVVLPALIVDLLRENIPVTLKLEGEGDTAELVYCVPGFYKSDGIIIRDRLDNDHRWYEVETRYDKESCQDLSDLAGLNWVWWRHSRDRNPAAWGQPDPLWLPLLLRYHLVQEHTQTVYHDAT